MTAPLNYEEMMEAGITNLLDTAEVSDVSAHATLSLPEELFPQGITSQSLREHVDFINNTEAQVEHVAAQLGRRAYEANNDITNFDASLDLGGVLTINSQHILQQQLGDNSVFGQSTTATDFVYSEDLTGWRDQMQMANAEEAAKLFG